MAGRKISGAGALGADATLAFYREQSTTWLRTLRAAFELDKAAGASATFCDGRIALIDVVLRERNAPHF